MLKITHIVNDPFSLPVSGADLRNFSINSALERCGNVETICVGFMLDTDAPKASNTSIVLDISPENIQKLIHRIAESKPDIIVVAGVAMLKIVKAIYLCEDLNKARIISSCHNVESNLLRQIDRIRIPSFARVFAPVFFWKRWKMAFRAEKTFFEMLDQAWVCSSVDLALLVGSKRNNNHILIVPNIIPDWCQQQKSNQPLIKKLETISAIFVGHLRYKPNTKAVLFLARKVWHEVTKRWPDARLTIVGRSPHRKIAKIASKTANIELVGDPESLLEFYQQSNVSIMPLGQGGGTRIKVLEVLSFGIPLIASSKAVEGIEIENGIHFIAAQTKKEIVAALGKLQEQPEFLNRLVINGRQFVYENHRQKNVDNLVKKYISQAINDL